MSANTRTEIVLRDGVFIHRSVTETNFGRQETALAAAASGQPTTLRNMMLSNMVPCDIHIAGSNFAIITPIKSIPVNCSWELQSSGYALPRFGQEPTTGMIEERCEFNIERATGMRGVIAVSFSRAGLYNNTYLYFIDKDGNAWVPPYPNVYEDGHICMGDEFQSLMSRSAGKSAHERSAMAVSSFYETRSNRDLLRAGYDIIFRRVPAGEFDKTENPTSYMVSASNALLVGYSINGEASS